MNKGALQVAVRHLAKSLAAHDAHADIYDAFQLAMPSAAKKHLALCAGDQKVAGHILLFEPDHTTRQTLLDRYLTGDGAGAYAYTERLIDVISGAVRNAKRLHECSSNSQAESQPQVHSQQQ